MSFTIIILLSTLALALAMFLLVGAGRRLGKRRVMLDPEGTRAGAGPVEAAAFGLYGLLIAFTFSGAAGRFDQRRVLVVEEANAIGTAYLRLDLLPTEPRARLQERFRAYLDARLAIYRALPDIHAAFAALERSNIIQGQIWAESVKACDGSPQTTMLLLPALNAMIDITTTRTAAAMMHPPPAVWGMLIVFSLGCAMLVGYSMASARTFNWMHATAFVLVTAAAVFVILELEYPRIGIIRLDPIDKVLTDLRASMK